MSTGVCQCYKCGGIYDDETDCKCAMTPNDKQKLAAFNQGWLEVLNREIMPAGKMVDGKMQTWQDLVSTLTVSEAKLLGRCEAGVYATVIGVKP